MTVTVGTRVRHRYDGATGVVVAVFPAATAAPGLAPLATGDTLYRVRFDDALVARQLGGDQHGDRAWLQEHYEVLDPATH